MVQADSLPRRLWFCSLVALLVRLTFLFVVFPLLETRMALNYDADGYGALADTILKGEYTDVERAPLYPALLAAVYSVSHHSNAAMKLLQAFIDTATIVCVWSIAQRIGTNPNLKHWAAWLYALYPLAWWRCGFINKETLETFVLLLFVWSFLVAIHPLRHAGDLISRRRAALYSLNRIFLSGLLLGLANLAKPIFLLLPVVIMLWLFWQRKKLVNAPAALISLLVGMAVVIIPWTIRNYYVTHELIPISLERGGLTAYVGNYYPNRGTWEGPHKADWQADLQKIAAEHPGVSAAQLDRIYLGIALHNVMARRGQFAEMFARKAWRFWFCNASGRMGTAVLVVQAIFLGAGLLGLFFRRLDSAAAGLFVLIIAYLWLLHAAIYADVRFSLPLMPLVTILAAALFPQGKDET